MLREQAQALLISLSHKRLWVINALVLFIIMGSSCVFEYNRKSFQVACDSIVTQPKITEFASDAWSLYKIEYQDDATVNVLLQQGPIDSGFLTIFNTYQWNLKDFSIISNGEHVVKFPLPCECEGKVVDESPDGKWQVVDTKIINEDGSPRYLRWLVSQNDQYNLGNATNWSWSTDGLYFSFMVPGHSYSGSLNLLNLQSLELVWGSYEGIDEYGDIPEGFLKPIAFNYNITFSPTDKTYWYRAWFPEDENKIYVYDPIARTGRIEHIENIRSAIWSNALNQLLFVKSDDESITITSEDGLVSAKIPYELYLEIDGEGLESELTHTNFQVSPQGNYVVFPKNGQMYALGCSEE